MHPISFDPHRKDKTISITDTLERTNEETNERTTVTMAEKDLQHNAGDQAAEAVAKLHLDDVTGEMISKTELKKRQKARQKDEEKAKKAAAKGPVQKSAKSAEAAEKELTPNQVRYDVNYFCEDKHSPLYVVLRDSITDRQRASRQGQGLPSQGWYNLHRVNSA